jgi:O-antigen ligase
MIARVLGPMLVSGLLLLFVFSGLLKWVPGLPLDPTLMFGSAVAACCAWRLLAGSVPVGQAATLVLGTALAFNAWYLLTAFFSVSTSFWTFKAATLVLNTLALVAPIVCLRTERHFAWFDRFLWVMAGACMALVFGFYLTGNIDFLIYQGFDKEVLKIPDYLVLASLIGLGTLSALSAPTPWRVVFAIAGFAAMLVLTARGPLLFAIVLVVLGGVFLRGRGRDARPGPLLVVLLLGVVAIAAVRWQGAEGAVTRFAGIFSDETAFEGALRVGEFSVALDVIAQAPLVGVGLGGYGMAGYEMEENIYPHNLLLEAFAEAGVVGLVLFVAAMAAVVVSGWRARHDPRVAGCFVLVLFLMLNYMKSGGFVGARDLYLFTGVLAARLNLPRDWSLALFGVPARRPG